MHDNWLTIVHIKDLIYLFNGWKEGGIKKDKQTLIHVFTRKMDKGKSIKIHPKSMTSK